MGVRTKTWPSLVRKYDLSLTDTIRKLGYPSRNMLVGGYRGNLLTGELHRNYKKKSKYSSEQLLAAVAYYPDHGCSITRTIKAIGYPSRPVLLERIDPRRLPSAEDALLAELESLKRQIYRQQLELDILSKAAEVVKKDLAIDPWRRADKEKASLIDALRTKYPPSGLLMTIKMSKSSYFYQRKARQAPD